MVSLCELSPCQIGQWFPHVIAAWMTCGNHYITPFLPSLRWLTKWMRTWTTRGQQPLRSSKWGRRRECIERNPCGQGEDEESAKKIVDQRYSSTLYQFKCETGAKISKGFYYAISRCEVSINTTPSFPKPITSPWNMTLIGIIHQPLLTLFFRKITIPTLISYPPPPSIPLSHRVLIRLTACWLQLWIERYDEEGKRVAQITEGQIEDASETGNWLAIHLSIELPYPLPLLPRAHFPNRWSVSVSICK